MQQRIQEAKTATIPHATNKTDQAREQALKKLNTELLRQKHMEVKTDTRKMIKYIGDTIIQIRNSFGEMCRGLGSQDSEVQALRELYRKEALQRKLLYNKLQELRGNIRVICRCRYDKTECHYSFPNEREVAVPGKKNYKFDQVFRPDSTQDQVRYKLNSNLKCKRVENVVVMLIFYFSSGIVVCVLVGVSRGYANNPLMC